MSFLVLRRLAIRWPSFFWSTEFNYQIETLLTTQLNYGQCFPLYIYETDGPASVGLSALHFVRIREIRVYPF